MTAVRISNGNGRVRVIAEDRDDVAVDGGTTDEADGLTTVTSHSDRVVVRVPIGTDVVVGTSSGRITVDGSVGALAATTESGRIEIESARTVDARAETGAITVEHAVEMCRARANTGRIEVGRSGAADVSTTTGRIELKQVDGPVHAHCVSGRIRIEMLAPHDVDADTVSGSVRVSMPSGTRVHLLDGKDDDTPAPPDCHCSVRASSVTGRVSVR